MTEKRMIDDLFPVMDYSMLNDIMLGPMRSSIILAALKLDIFSFLSDEKTAWDISEIIGAEEKKVSIFLDGLVSENLLEKEDGLYLNTPESSAFLVKKSPSYLGDMFLSLAKLRYLSSDDIVGGLTGEHLEKIKSYTEIDMSKQARWGKAAEYLANYQRAGIARQVADIVKSLPEGGSFKNILDLGGGPGIVGICLVLDNEDSRGVIFDLPMVAEEAEKNIEKYGLSGRMRAIRGDYNSDSIGSGYDLVFASLNLYYSKDLEELMRKLYESLNPGGLFMSYHEGLCDERTAPEEHVIGRLSVALRGQDLSFNKGEIAGKMKKAGFKKIESMTIDTSNGPIDIDISRRSK